MDDLYVFISYAHADKAIAEQVEAFLKARGIRTFRDATDMRSGIDWDNAIEAALRAATRMVLLLSTTSMPERPEVEREWFYFLQEKKPIHPLYLEQCTLNSRIRRINYIDAQTNLYGALEKLLADLREPVSVPTASSTSDRITVVDAAELESRSINETFAALRLAVCNPQSHLILSKNEVQALITHSPIDLMEYRLARIAEWSQARYALDSQFVNLTLLFDQGEDAQGSRWVSPSRYRFNDLRDVLNEYGDSPALVLLGIPGSGKSTLLRRLQLDDAVDHLCARIRDERITFLVSLNAYFSENDQPPLPRAWLSSEWERRYPHLPKFDTLLNRGQLLLLVDALNEMPLPPNQVNAEYDKRVVLWRNFILDMTRHGNRAVFSCRSLDYSGLLSSDDLPVPHVVIQSMDGYQVREFLKAHLPVKTRVIWEALAGTSQFNLFSTPYLLKLFAQQIESTGTAPKDVAELFTNLVRRSLKREIESENLLLKPNGLLNIHDRSRVTQNKWSTPYDLPEEGLLIPKLSELAHRMQSARSAADNIQVLVDYKTARNFISHERNTDILKVGVDLNILDEAETGDKILFFHQLLQEFFAARVFAEHPDLEKIHSEWQVGQVEVPLEIVRSRLPLSDPLPLLPRTGWEETAVLAAAMSDHPSEFVRKILKTNLPLAGRCAGSSAVRTDEALKHEIQHSLIQRLHEPLADLRARIEAALVLGELGDPRFKTQTGTYGTYIVPPLVPILGGEYIVGTNNGMPEEAPERRVTLKAFQIGKFPVTNKEYALFIASGGYVDEHWWTAEGAKEWLSGDVTRAQRQTWREQRQIARSLLEDDKLRVRVRENRMTPEEAETWENLAKLSDTDFEIHLSEWFPLQRPSAPEYWLDSNFNAPSQPVVGVSWFEAQAYCAWLSAQSGESFRVLTEEEYEAAARGKQGRIYAFGNVFDDAACNTLESHIRRPTPVGIFPTGETPEGCADLAGNIWQWTAKDRTDETRAVARGGCWAHLQRQARACARFRKDSGVRANLIGFRVACAKPE